MLHDAMTVVCPMVATILLTARSLQPAAGAKVLLGASIGMGLCGPRVLRHVDHGGRTALPLLVIMSALAVEGFATVMNAKGETTEGSPEDA